MHCVTLYPNHSKKVRKIRIIFFLHSIQVLLVVFCCNKEIVVINVNTDSLLNIHTQKKELQEYVTNILLMTIIVLLIITSIVNVVIFFTSLPLEPSVKCKLSSTCQHALKAGLELKNVHRIIKFEQENWLSSYINMNNELRKKATTESVKNLTKLMNNVIYGKCLENIFKRRKIYLVNEWASSPWRKGAQPYIGSGYFKKLKIFNENLIAVELGIKRVKLDKPNIGFCILELSKLLLYEFYYDGLCRMYSGNELSLLYTDTDSLIYEVNSKSYYEEMYLKINDENEKILKFDTSNFHPENQLGYKLLNKQVIGYMKFEVGDSIIKEFIGIRPKSYYIDVVNPRSNESEIHLRNKGIDRNVGQSLTRQDYIDCVYNREKRIYRRMNNFRSHSAS